LGIGTPPADGFILLRTIVKSNGITKLSWARTAISSLLLTSISMLAGCDHAGGSTSAPAPLKTIGFITDFDTRDDAVGICKAVMEGIAPGVKIIDISHQVTPFDVAEGARFLAGSVPYFAKDSIFVAVVDPGVGTSRKAMIAKSKVGQFFVLPDNGLLTLVQKRDGIESAREITNPDWMIGTKLSSTFHGRDIFSPAAGHLSRGDDWTNAGPVLDVAKLVQLDLHDATIDGQALHGSVIGTDGPYGNLVLNVPADTFSKLGYRIGDTVPVTLNARQYKFPFAKTFGEVPVGKPLFFIDSRGRLSLGVNQGNFAQIYKIAPPAELTIPGKGQ
jgi:S-adenosylmethionine hydrolase